MVCIFQLGSVLRAPVLRALVLLLTFSVFPGLSGASEKYAAVVMDARNGHVIHSRYATKSLHPASLTKLMMLYIAFEAIESGEIDVDKLVTISRHAASEPPSSMGLVAGTKVKLRYLIRGAAVRSANDAATAIAEAISGSEGAFIKRMNRTAKALGLHNTHFKNAHGLTESGHKSTAMDMTLLGRHIIYDYPEYYNLFARRTTDAGIKTVRNTNRKLLNSYNGADGIKTGYTRAAGFNLVASAKRGNVRIIVTVFGGRTSTTRNEHVKELLDMGFQNASAHVSLQKPKLPDYSTNEYLFVTAKTRCAVPMLRPDSIAMSLAIDDAVERAIEQGSALEDDLNTRAADWGYVPGRPSFEPVFRPRVNTRVKGPAAKLRKEDRSRRNWGISLGGYANTYLAERALVRVAILLPNPLATVGKKVIKEKYSFDAAFVDMTEVEATAACNDLRIRDVACTVFAFH